MAKGKNSSEDEILKVLKEIEGGASIASAPEHYSARSRCGYAPAPMWHHYANKHEGVCLMFDRLALQEALV